MRRLGPYLGSALLALALVLSGCSDDRNSLRVASQDFTEQKLLAEMMALLAEEQGLNVERSIPYGDNRQNLAAIQRGLIDAYPAYSGSLLTLSGLDARGDEEQVAARLRELLEPLGLRWLEPFGLDSTFALSVRRYDAIRYGLSTIDDLKRLPGSPHFGADPGFLSRPIDGLYALARRYGLTIGQVTEYPMDARLALFSALRDGQIDVAETFSTDAWLEDYSVVVLRDNLNFYPSYYAAPLVRGDILDANPQLAKAWQSLAGRLEQDTMRKLNSRVERAGEDYRDVARRYLEELQLLAPSGDLERKRQVTLAVNPVSSQGTLPIRAGNAIREVMPARRLGIEVTARPVEAVRKGEARFGLAGAEEFYEVAEDGSVRQRDDIEAVGVVGTRLIHLVERSNGPTPSEWRRLGVSVEGGSSWTVARLLLEAMGLSQRIELVPIERRPEESAGRLLTGELDAAVLMVEQGHPGLMQLLRGAGLRLAAVKAFSGESEALRYPFLRQAIIPAGIYPGQSEALPTLAAQVVIVTRRPAETDLVGESGPGYIPGVFTRLPQRLPFDTARRLNAALDYPETVDPLLPASPGLRAVTPATEPHVYADPPTALVNVLAVAFLVSMILLYMRPLPPNPALSEKTQPPEE